MYQNMSTLSELKHKQQLIQQQIHDLKTEMDSFKPDEEQPDESDALKLLPPPLLPQKMSAESVVNEAQVSAEESLDLFTPKEAKEEENCSTDDDPFGPLSLTVQGRVIPCIPCDNKSPNV